VDTLRKLDAPSRRRRALATLAVAVALAVGGCARPPARLAGIAFEELGIADARDPSRAGTRVRWGGTIAGVTTGKDETCFEIVRRPLDRQARPRRTDDSDGRFLACIGGFYDPEVYARDRLLTIVGTLQAPTTRKIGDYDYAYPLVAVESLYLWPRPEEQGVCGAPPPYCYGTLRWDPFWGLPWRPYPSWYWRPFWYPRSFPRARRPW